MTGWLLLLLQNWLLCSMRRALRAWRLQRLLLCLLLFLLLLWWKNASITYTTSLPESVTSSQT